MPGVDDAMTAAIRALAPTAKPGTTVTLGPPTTGHWCRACNTANLHAADVLRITEDGVTTIAVLRLLELLMAGRVYDQKAHRGLREQLRPTVDTGQAWCTEPICIEPTRWIAPGTPWDLAHDRQTGQHRGPAHARCNRSEAHAYTCRSPKHDHRPHTQASQDW
jgi:hypothetical protein